MGEILRLENVSFQYENDYTALRGVTVAIESGERIAVLGNNGAGKSTFFLCCNGVLKPKSGRVILKGRELTLSKKELLTLRQTVGLVFQEPDSQIIAGTVENEVSFGPMNLGLSMEETAGRVTEALSRMELERYRGYAPHYLSGGEKKRVTIADILAMRPEIILFDEPTASLDPENTEILLQTLRELSDGGITLVVSTHDVDFAYRFAERAIVFSSGEVIADAGIDEVFASDGTIRRAGLKKPTLYAAAQALVKRFPALEGEQWPKAPEEFEAFIGRI